MRKSFSLSSSTFLVISIILVSLSCKPILSLGKNPKGDDLKQIEALPNYTNGMFHNLDTAATTRRASTAGTQRRMPWTRLIRFMFENRDSLGPQRPVPYVLTDLKQLPAPRPTVIWLGHSTVLIKSRSANILLDPIFSGYAGPFRGNITAYRGTNEYGVKDLPPIDIVMVSHDHYDHLDYTTIRQLRKKIKRIIVPSGVGSHLRYWGYDRQQVTELYWNESYQFSQQVTITATPAHHRSNRTLKNRKTLWASYVIEVDGYKLYFSGDTGYSSHFRTIGEQYGPFDLALLECGQYNLRWPQSHMFPFQVVRAAKDLEAKMIWPVHWGKFTESEHHWNEPVNLLLKSADSFRMPVTVPYIGQPFTIGSMPSREQWWNTPD